jgi:hypothetical protein
MMPVQGKHSVDEEMGFQRKRLGTIWNAALPVGVDAAPAGLVMDLAASCGNNRLAWATEKPYALGRSSPKRQY